MKISFSTAGLFPKTTIDALKLLENTGYEYAELMPQCRDETQPSFAVNIERETRIRISSIHFPLVFFSTLYNPYPGMVQEFKKLSDDIVTLGAVLKSEIIVVHPPYFSDETVREIFEDSVLENVRYLCDIASSFGIRVVLENSPKGGRTPQEMMDWAEKIGHENLHFMVDTTEAVESSQDPIELIKSLNPVHMHVSDHRGEEKHLPPGEGDMDWREIISALEEIDFSGYIVLEPSYRYLLSDTSRKLEDMRRYMEGFL